MSDAAESLRYVFATLPLCPKCGGAEYRVYGTEKCDGGKTQWAKCRNAECEHKFKIIWEGSPQCGIPGPAVS